MSRRRTGSSWIDGPPGGTRPGLVAAALLRWFGREAEELPWRRIRDPYAIWVSEVMLQQTQVATVVPYFERWMQVLPQLRSLAEAKEERVLRLWEGLGYYRRARHLQQAAREIMGRFGGELPREFDDLLRLPGIGRYTAGALGSIAWNRPWPVVDGNVLRVLARLDGVCEPAQKASTLRAIEQRAASLVEAAERSRVRFGRGASADRIGWRLVREAPCGALNQALMELGRRICTPKGPACGKCPLRRWCVAARSGRPETLPVLPPRPTGRSERRVALILEDRGRYWVRRRPTGEVNGGLWEFPEASVPADGSGPEWICRLWPFAKIVGQEPFGVVRHSIMDRRIRLEGWRARRWGNRRPQGPGCWVALAELAGKPMPAAHRRLTVGLMGADQPVH